MPAPGLRDLESHSEPFPSLLSASLSPQTLPALPTASPASVHPDFLFCHLLNTAGLCFSVHSLALLGSGTYLTVRFFTVFFFHQQFCAISTSCHWRIHHVKPQEVTPASPKLFISIIPPPSEVQTGDYLFSLLTSIRLLKVWICW